MNGNVIDGTYTLREAIYTTYRHYRSRIDNMKRDVVKRITIKEVIDLKIDRPKEPTKRYIISTRSYPQYAPYVKTGQARRQRKIHHDYESSLEMDELTLHTKNWKAVVGSMKKWKTAPQHEIKSIRRETMQKWIAERDAKLRRARTARDKERIRKEHLKRISNHKKSAKFLDEGDWNARKRGINGDFIFRCAYAYFYEWSPLRSKLLWKCPCTNLEPSRTSISTQTPHAYYRGIA